MGAATARVERRLPSLAVVEVGFLVGRQRCIDDLPPEKQAQIRRAYADTDFHSDTGMECLGFYTDLEAAEEQAARYPGGFVLSLPVNGCRPEELGRYGIQVQPNSANREWYEKTSPGVICSHVIDRDEVEKLACEMKEHVKGLTAIAS